MVFVLLSKFDVPAFLKKVPADIAAKFMDTLDRAIFSFGLKPSDDKMLILGVSLGRI